MRTMVRLLQSPSYCILLYEDMGAVRKVATHKRFLLHMMIDWSSLQLLHCFIQPSYVSNLICGVCYYCCCGKT